MNIDLIFQPPMRRWHVELAEALSGCGHQVRYVAGDGKPLSTMVGAAVALQQRVFGPVTSLFDMVSPPLDVPRRGATDLAIALDGTSSFARRVLEPLFDGHTGDAALVTMVSAGRPTVRVVERTEDATVDLVSAQLAIEDRNTLSRALDQVLARILSLIVQAVRRLEQGTGPAVSSTTEAPRAVSPLVHIGRGLAHKIAGRLPGARLSPNDWRIGYRCFDGGGVADGHAWSGPAYSLLSGGRDRFLADPMPFVSEGRSYIFFEDYPYATSKGVIGLVEIAEDGTAAPPRTVLEQPVHLSYPLILRHRGEIYMLPEMCAARRVQLFRADPFPDRWVPDRILLDGCVAADATPVLHDGRWWLFATLSDDGGSSWDQLCLFHAPDLLGPWTPHDDNPVLVDAGQARPAGAMWQENGTLMRVAQDCRDGYGRGLAICRVDRLDPRGYAQSVVARLGPPDGYGADGAHTLNRAGRLEVIDLRFPRY